MKDKNIKEIWKETLGSEFSTTRNEHLLRDLNGTVKKVEGQIKVRDRLEIITALLIIPVFVFALFTDLNIWSRLGALIIIAYCFLVIFMLRNVKKHKKAFDPLSTIKDQMINMRDYLSKEKELLDNVFYWYLLPPFIGASLFFIGSNTKILSSIISISMVALLYFFIYRLNKRAVKNKFIPLIQELDLAINELNTPD